MGASAIPLAVFLFDLFWEGKKPDQSLAGIKFFIIPTVLFTIFALPFFRFKSSEKVDEEKALIKIPVVDFGLWIFMGIGFFLIFAGILSYLDKESTPLPNYIFGGVGMAIPCLCLLNSNSVLFRDDYLTKKEKHELEQKKTSVGLFHYDEYGFNHPYKSAQFSTLWSEIDSIVSYKTDSYAFDTIRLVVEKTDGENFLLSEATEGFLVFTKKLSERLVGIDEAWLLKVMYPPFEECVTQVYKKGET